MRLRLRIATALALLLVVGTPTLAHASGTAVINDCSFDGQLSKTYSQKDYADALAHLPADVDEYSDCRDVISRARLAAAGRGTTKNGNGGSGSSGAAGGGTGGGGTSGGAGSTAGGGASSGSAGADTSAATATDPFADATPQERAAYQKAVQAGAGPVHLDGRPITPGSLGGASSTDVGDLPTPLLVVLILLAVGGAGAAGLVTRRRVLDRRTA